MFFRTYQLHISFPITIVVLCFLTSCSTAEETENTEKDQHHSENIERLRAACNKGANTEWREGSCFNTDTGKEIPEKDVTLLPTHSSPSVLLIGDSLTAGVHVATDESYPKVAEAILKEKKLSINFIQRSSPRIKTEEAVPRLTEYISDDTNKKPTHVFFALGFNDAFILRPVNDIKKNVENSIVEAKKQEITPLLAELKAPDGILDNPQVQELIKNFNVPNEHIEKYINSFESIFPDLAQKHKVALWPHMLKDVGNLKNKNLMDGIHPNAEGHKIMGTRFAQFLQKHLKPFLTTTHAFGSSQANRAVLTPKTILFTQWTRPAEP